MGSPPNTSENVPPPSKPAQDKAAKAADKAQDGAAKASEKAEAGGADKGTDKGAGDKGGGDKGGGKGH